MRKHVFGMCAIAGLLSHYWIVMDPCIDVRSGFW